MAHGWGAVKEMYLDNHAAAVVDAEFATLVYDNRNFGASEELPRQEIDVWAPLPIDLYRHAITFACTLAEIDRTRIGVWGTSLSGGHSLVVAAVDRRVKCVVAQCPTISGWRNALRRFPGDELAEAPAMIPIAPDLDMLPGGQADDVGIEALKPLATRRRLVSQHAPGPARELA